MNDHSITFTPEQNLVLDSYVKKINELKFQLQRSQGEVTRLEQSRVSLMTSLETANQRRREAEQQNNTPEEEEIRASERNRISLWFEHGGHDKEHLYQAYNTAVSRYAVDLARNIRDAEHNRTYFEHRQESDPEWPEAYDMQPADYDFDVHTRVWERG